MKINQPDYKKQCSTFNLSFHTLGSFQKYLDKLVGGGWGLVLNKVVTAGVNILYYSEAEGFGTAKKFWVISEQLEKY